VTASGSASVTQNTTIIARTPASLWAASGTGQRQCDQRDEQERSEERPIVRRRLLNCSSAGE
jgi:hypothetical protein